MLHWNNALDVTSIKNTLRCLLDPLFSHIFPIKVLHCKHLHFSSIIQIITMFCGAFWEPCGFAASFVVLQSIRYWRTCRLLDHNHNLCVFPGAARTNLQRNINAGGIFFLSTSSPHRLPSPASDESVSRSCLRSIPVLENELLLDVKTSSMS